MGHRFPGARVTLPAYVAWLWADALGAEPDPEVAHPSLAYLVALEGTGVSVREILELMGSSPDGGALLGELALECRAPLVPGTTYECDGRIVAATRKQGARSGVFDRFDFTVSIREEPAAPPLGSCTFTWIVPRDAEAP